MTIADVLGWKTNFCLGLFYEGKKQILPWLTLSYQENWNIHYHRPTMPKVIIWCYWQFDCLLAIFVKFR